MPPVEYYIRGYHMVTRTQTLCGKGVHTMRTYTLTFTEQEITTIIKALSIAEKSVIENACNGKLTESDAESLFRTYYYVHYDISEATERPII